MRAVYNTGESVDSNPVVASLNPLKPTSHRSPSNQSPNHSSDEEAGGRSSSKGLPPPAALGEYSSTTREQQDSMNHSLEQSPPSNNDEQHNNEVASVPTDVNEMSISFTQLTPTNELPPGTPPKHDPTLPPESPQFRFQKAKHITIDTVSVLSGCTIEYSALPVVAATSADTLLGESSLEMDNISTSSSDSESTTTSINFSKMAPKEQLATIEPTENSSNTSLAPDQAGISHPPATAIPTTSAANNQSLQTLPPRSFDVPVTEMSASTFKHTSGMLPPMSHDTVQESDQLLTLRTHRELSLVHNPPGNNSRLSHVLASALGVCPNNSGMFGVNSGLEFNTDIPHSNTIALKENTRLSGTELSSVTSHIAPEITSMVKSEKQNLSTDTQEPFMISEAVGGKIDGTNNELVSSNTMSAMVTVSAAPISAGMTNEMDTDFLPLKVRSSVASSPGSQPVDSMSSLSPVENQEPDSTGRGSNSSTSSDVASQLLVELEKSLSQSD